MTTRTNTLSAALQTLCTALADPEVAALIDRLMDQEGQRLDRVLDQYRSLCPTGYNTVLGFMADHYSESLAQLGPAPYVTSQDGKALTRRAKERGLCIPQVPACQWLREHGIKKVNAYPLEILHEYFRTV